MPFGVNYQDPNAQRAYGSPFDTANVAQQGVQNQMAEAQRQDQLMQFLRNYQFQVAQAREQSRQFERQYGLQKHAQRQADAFQVPKLIGAWSEGILSPFSELVQLGGALFNSPDSKLSAAPSASGGSAGSFSSMGSQGLVPQMGSPPGGGGGAGEGVGSFLGGGGGGLGIFGGAPPGGTTGGHGLADFLDTQTGGLLGKEGLFGLLSSAAGGDAGGGPSLGPGGAMQAPTKLEPMFQKSMSYYDPSRREYVPGVPTGESGGATFSDESVLDLADDAISKGMGAADVVKMLTRYMGGG